jgi:large subunit ribosomal protein L30
MPRTFVWHPSKGPAKSPKLEKAGTGKLRITQVRSAIGHSATMGLTLAAIGLKHHQASVVQQDSPSLRGQLKKVRHLVEVTPVEGEG